MGRPRELTDADKQQLIAEGYKPVEVWLPDIWSSETWEQIYRDCDSIRASEKEADIDLWVEGAVGETMRLVDEMERDAR